MQDNNVYLEFAHLGGMHFKKPNNGSPTGYGNEVYYVDDNQIGRHYPPRTKATHPYNYDPIILIHASGNITSSAYSDRMRSWEPEKFDFAIGQGVGEMRFSWGRTEAVNAFLHSYYDDPTIKIVKVMEYCNVATGYPCWFLAWGSAKK